MNHCLCSSSASKPGLRAECDGTPVVGKHVASSPLEGAVGDPGTCLSSFSWTPAVICLCSVNSLLPVNAFSRGRCQGAPHPGPACLRVCFHEPWCVGTTQPGPGSSAPSPTLLVEEKMWSERGRASLEAENRTFELNPRLLNLD